MYDQNFHARSVDGRPHPESQSIVKAIHAKFAHDIPLLWRICAENVFAQHSIAYKGLDDYLFGFSIWNEFNESLSWDETLVWFEILGITPVRVLYDGIYDEKAIKNICQNLNWELCEGATLRKARKFGYGEFRTSVVKFVREGHVQTRKHWKYGQKVVPNLLSEKGKEKVFGH